MDHDLTLVLDGDVKGATVEIHTWHQIVANASPFFRAMLARDRFAEGAALKRDGCLRLKLLDTDACAMQIICDIFHLNSSKVPVVSLTSDTLFNVAVLVDRFGCVNAMQPWVSVWKQQAHLAKEVESVNQMSVQGHAKWICICQYLGFAEAPEALTLQLTFRVDALDFERDDDVYFCHLPLSLSDQMKNTRLTVARRFREILVELMRLVEEGNTCQLLTSADLDLEIERFHCSSILLGNTTFALRDFLGNDWRSEPWGGPISVMYETMRLITGRLTGPNWIVCGGAPSGKKRISTHTECSMDLKLYDQISEVVKDFQHLIDDSPLSHVTGVN